MTWAGTSIVCSRSIKGSRRCDGLLLFVFDRKGLDSAEVWLVDMFGAGRHEGSPR